MKTKTAKQIEKLAGIELSFGKALWALRTADGFTQEVFAAQLSVSKQYLSAIENGRKSVSIDQAKRFATILGQSEKVFIKYVLQDLLVKSQVYYEVDLHALKRTKMPAASRRRA